MSGPSPKGIGKGDVSGSKPGQGKGAKGPAPVTVEVADRMSAINSADRLKKMVGHDHSASKVLQGRQDSSPCWLVSCQV